MSTTPDITARQRPQEPSLDAQKMEVLSRLGSGVAHDLNNLLVVIRSYGDLLLMDQALAEPQRKQLMAIRSAADRAVALAHQLTVFTRKQIVAPRVLAVNEVARSVEPLLRQIVPRDLRFELVLGEEAGHVEADAHDIEQLLANLALIAADAMPTGGRFTIGTTATTLDERYANAHAGVEAGAFGLISVSYDGIGTEHATFGRVAEPPIAADALGQRTEIGLAFIPAMVQRLHGHLVVADDGSGGTTFRIHLPRIHIESVERPAIAGTPSIAVVARGGETILIVEDAADVRVTLAHVLTRLGYAVLETDRGEDALRIVAAHEGPIHLLISDLTMPGMSGPQLVKRLLDSRPGTRILFTSGYSGDEALRRGLIEEKQAFIPKPFTIDEVANKVRDVLDGA